jgi:hypothetical protein
MRFVQHVVNFFFVNLEVAAVDSVFFAAEVGLLLNQLIEQPDRAGYDAFIFPRLNDCLWNTFIVLSILVAFHRKCFPGTGLSIGEDCCVESINHLFDEVVDATVSENLPLAGLMVKNYIELRILVGFCAVVVRAVSKKF